MAVRSSSVLSKAACQGRNTQSIDIERYDQGRHLPAEKFPHKVAIATGSVDFHPNMPHAVPLTRRHSPRKHQTCSDTEDCHCITRSQRRKDRSKFTSTLAKTVEQGARLQHAKVYDYSSSQGSSSLPGHGQQLLSDSRYHPQRISIGEPLAITTSHLQRP